MNCTRTVTERGEPVEHYHTVPEHRNGGIATLFRLVLSSKWASGLRWRSLVSIDAAIRRTRPAATAAAGVPANAAVICEIKW